MNLSVKFNLARYIVSILLPLCLICYPLIAMGTTFCLLLANNILDSLMFYFANLEVSKIRFTKSGIISPVNGIVTLVENNVPLYYHVTKRDPLTKKELFKTVPHTTNDNRKFHHVAVFLNKFNHHVVLNISEVDKILQRIQGENKVMVEDGELIADNEGEYIDNDTVYVKYRYFSGTDEVFIVLTLDKYVSQYLIGREDIGHIGSIICRGSQCDIYTTEPIACKEGDLLNIGDKIAYCNTFTPNNVGEEEIEYIVSKGIALSGGVRDIVVSSFMNTIETFKSPFITATVILGVSLTPLSTMFSYVAFLGIYLFVYDRFFKHLMYALMNAIGYRPIMSKAYKVTHKLSILWKKRILR